MGWLNSPFIVLRRFVFPATAPNLVKLSYVLYLLDLVKILPQIQVFSHLRQTSRSNIWMIEIHTSKLDLA